MGTITGIHSHLRNLNVAHPMLGKKSRRPVQDQTAAIPSLPPLFTKDRIQLPFLSNEIEDLL